MTNSLNSGSNYRNLSKYLKPKENTQLAFTSAFEYYIFSVILRGVGKQNTE